MNTLPTHFSRASPKAAERGFSLVELLVVVSFIAILASIAIPRFNTVKDLAVDAAVKSDLQNAMKAQEGWYADHGEYAAFDIEDGGTATEPPIEASNGVDLTGTLITGGIRIVGSHASSSRSWCISTEVGKVAAGTTC